MLIDSHYFTIFRKNVVSRALKELAVSIILKSNDKNWQWLYVVPLYHFMLGLSSPYETIPLDKEIQWLFWHELEDDKIIIRKKQQPYRLLFFVIQVNAHAFLFP